MNKAFLKLSQAQWEQIGYQQKWLRVAGKFIKKCAWCGKTIETIEIPEKSVDEISHGICNECYKLHAPDES